MGVSRIGSIPIEVLQIIIFIILVLIKTITHVLLTDHMSREEGKSMGAFKLIFAALFDNLHMLGFAYFSGSLLTKNSLE